MKKRISFIIILLITFLITSYSNTINANENGLLVFLDKLKALEYEINNEMEYFEEYESEDNQFAEEFLKDFLLGNVEFISPIYKTDDINDSKLQWYLSKYPQIKFEKGQVIR